MNLVDRVNRAVADSRTESRAVGGVPWRLRPWDDPY